MNITGSGVKITIFDKGGKYPNGYLLTEFSDDTDAIDIANKTIATTAMAVNGTMVYWAQPSPLELTISVIADGNEDIYLSSLFQANDPSRGRKINDSSLTMIIIYPNGTTKTLLKGKIIEGSPMSSVASNGRKKTKTFKFCFESYK